MLLCLPSYLEFRSAEEVSPPSFSELLVMKFDVNHVAGLQLCVPSTEKDSYCFFFFVAKVRADSWNDLSYALKVGKFLACFLVGSWFVPLKVSAFFGQLNISFKLSACLLNSWVGFSFFTLC